MLEKLGMATTHLDPSKKGAIEEEKLQQES